MSTGKIVEEAGRKFRSQKADIETSSDDYARRFAGPVGEYLLAIQEEIALSLIDLSPDCRILDVGGGHGQLAVPLVQRKHAVTVAGSDDTCRRRLDRALPSGSFQFKVCDLLALPFEDRSFDVVLAFRLLTHEENWPVQISELCRVARQAVIVDYPDIRSSNFLYQGLFSIKKGFEKNTREFTLFHRSQIVAEFQKYGFPRITLKPQFFWPMVVHRFFKSPPLSRTLEGISAGTGLTHLFGSPIIVRACRAE